MKKIATITFHASYNYGSNLQAYALQEYIKKIGANQIDYNIINLRTPIQKEMYKSIFEKKGLKNNIKKILYFKYKKDLDGKQKKFEDFINNNLNITKEYNSLLELEKDTLNYDYFISGSDQVWNSQAVDFDWANYLEFVKKGKKLSYAASFGPLKQNWSEEEKERIRKNLQSYDYISVREEGSFENVKKLIGKNPDIHVDPTMLLTEQDWTKLIKPEPLIKEDYILLYDLKRKPETAYIAKKISELTGMQVVITRESGKKIYLSNFKKYFDCGPIEFLNLLKNSKLVLSSSFHGAVFSVIFHKPFFAINGDKDFRISTMLKKMGLSNRSINETNIEEKMKINDKIDFEKAEELLNVERKKAELYLKKSLDLE